jgi:hypothetical protein
MGQLDTIFRDYNDPFGYLSSQGRMYRASGAALNTVATGATSFATTTPTFLLRVKAGANYAVIPAEARLFQAGTVAGGAITYLMEIDNADRYTSGGTELLYQNCKTNGTALGSLPSFTSGDIQMFDTNSSAITATNAVGIRLDGALLGQDVSTAEGAVNEIVWAPQAGIEILAPTASLGASWLINTSAGTTGPSWFYSFKFAVVPLAWLT